MSAEVSSRTNEEEDRVNAVDETSGSGNGEQAGSARSGYPEPAYSAEDRGPPPAPKSLKGRKLFIGGVSWDTTDGRCSQVAGGA